jgi:hypothetical protein
MTRTATLPLPLATGDRVGGGRHGLRDVLGAGAWQRLPEAVRERFGEAGGTADYGGSFEIVRASVLGRCFAWAGTLIGTPVAPRVGANVEARVMVRPRGAGSAWIREYRWGDGARDVVESTKTVNDDLTLTERLPAGLCMPLEVFEAGGALHFVSREYYFDFGRFAGREWRLHIPTWLAPGTTHVEHTNLGRGWFRFTMTVTHPWFGEMFFQTGRFCAAEFAT